MTAPLVPADVDLRGVPWMPYFGHLLRGSELNATVSDAGFRAAHNLWWAAWNEVPAASLPDDDRILTRMADLGSAVDQFLAVKAEALHGFIKCNDGRLYHKFLASEAVKSWEYLVKQNAHRIGARNRMRKLRGTIGDVRETDGRIVREPIADVTRNSEPPLRTPPYTNKQTTRSRATPPTPQGGSFFAKNGGSGAAEPPPPVNPKFLNHGDVCSCSNCTRWAAQQRTSQPGA